MSDSRERILEAARSLYLEENLQGFSMRKVAAKVGFSATAIYRHYRDKEALLYAVMRQGHEMFYQDILKVQDQHSHPLMQLQDQANAYVEFALEHDDFYRMMFMDPMVIGPVGLPEEVFEDSFNTFELMVQKVERCINEDVFRAGADVNAHEIALTVWGHVHGLCSLYLTKRILAEEGDEVFRRFARRSSMRLMQGFIGRELAKFAR